MTCMTSTFNEFRPNIGEQKAASLAEMLKARLGEASPQLAAYVQGTKLVIPLADVNNATVSVSLSPDKQKIVSLKVSF
jgi:hypothetical protein